MKITVKFAQQMRTLTKADQTIVNLSENALLSDLLKTLAKQYGEQLMNIIYNSEMGPFETWASVIVDGKAVSLTHESNTKLKENSVVVLLVAASGG